MKKVQEMTDKELESALTLLRSIDSQDSLKLVKEIEQERKYRAQEKEEKERREREKEKQERLKKQNLLLEQQKAVLGAYFKDDTNTYYAITGVNGEYAIATVVYFYEYKIGKNYYYQETNVRVPLEKIKKMEKITFEEFNRFDRIASETTKIKTPLSWFTPDVTELLERCFRLLP